ncbi:unnamed protein product [Ixodes hexagonus]
MSLTMDCSVSTPHVDTHANVLGIMWFWHQHNWRDPWCWSLSFFDDVKNAPVRLRYRLNQGVHMKVYLEVT